MNPKFPLRFGEILTLVVAFLAAQALGQTNDPTKIRLRAGANTLFRGAPAPETDRFDGLALIEFKGDIQPEFLEELERLNCSTLKYIPDNGALVLVHGTALSDVDNSPSVMRCAKYTAEMKVEPGLLDKLNAEEGVEIRAVAHKLCRPEDLERVSEAFGMEPKRTPTRFGHIFQGKVTRESLRELADLSSTVWIESAPKPQLLDEISTEIVLGSNNSRGDLAQVHDLGYRGAGVAVAVADSGLDQGTLESVHPDLEGRVNAFFAYGLPSAADGHGHGTHVAGIVAAAPNTGQTDDEGYAYGLGVAPEAEIVVQRIFDAEGGYTLDDDFETLTRDAIRSGAVIGSNSWGDIIQGVYDISAMRFDALTRDADPETPGDQPYILEFSAGNSGAGLQTINSPAVAKNVIATGASQSERAESFIYLDGPESMADFSSRGPAQDGRIKPDVVAPGTWIASLQSSGAPDSNAWQPINSLYQYQGGTSQSGPHVSGAAAVFVDFYRREIEDQIPSPALVKAAMIHSTVNLEDSFGTRPIPNVDEGWGRVDLTNLIGTDAQIRYHDQAELLEQGEVYTQRVLVADARTPLRVTLVYTDPPGLPASIPALVNDLDLEIQGPGGVVYAGNQMDNGVSTPHPAGRDRINNVEGAIIHAPIPGEYRITVRGHRVIEDARVDSPGLDQDFALIWSGALQRPGEGLIVFDRPTYNAPSQVNLQLIDEDIAGNEDFFLDITSDTESSGEPVLFQESESPGIFTGSIQTALGAPQSDGQLQISEGDQLTVTYEDASPPATRTNSATADLSAPELLDLRLENQFGKIRVQWESNEPTSAILTYRLVDSTDEALQVEVPQPRTSVFLEDLQEGAEYALSILLIDPAGNQAEFTDNVPPYRFTGPSAPTALLVDAFYSDVSLLGILEFPAPPLTNYTDALDRLGITYDVWDILENGSPELEDLLPFRVVLWRFPEPTTTPPAFLASEQAAISEYLEADGSVFIASMDLLSRVEESAFARDTLNVATFNPDVGYTEIEGVEGVTGVEDLFIDLDFRDYDPFGGILGLSLQNPPAGPSLPMGSDLLEQPTPRGFDFDFAFNWSDTFVTTTNAIPIMKTRDEGKPVALRYPADGIETPGRLIFAGFPVDALPEDTSAPNNRDTFLKRAFDFLAPGAEGVGRLALDRPRYSLPSRMEIDIADSDLAGQPNLEARIFSDSVPEGQVALLTATPREGEFKAAITLTPSNSDLDTELFVQEGDTIRVEYVDVSNGVTLSQSAPTDLDAPVIDSVEVISDYASARVRWTTDEASDALVEFGESQFFNRSAFDPNFQTSRELQLQGLRPEKSYVFQIVSRDEAGNATIDDNNGGFYTFRTLSPEPLPWTDPLNQRETGWAVIERQEFIPPDIFNFISGVSEWQFGDPSRNPLRNDRPESGPVWGSNLEAQITEGADSMLLTPAFQLEHGFNYTLRFDASYDFSTPPSAELYSVTGEAFVTTDNGRNFEEVAAFTGRSNGWDSYEIDLSPFQGQLVRVGFYFGFIDAFNYENVLQPGWLLDNFSIESELRQEGELRITSNLHQAAYSIDGPETLEGSGLETTFAAIKNGAYQISFTETPFYATPAPTSIELLAGDSIEVHGEYTFPDTNNNGISDAWELEFFGTVDADSPPSRDADGDLSSDYHEFIAGTDPTDPTDRFVLAMPVILDSNELEILWRSTPSRRYRLEATTSFLEWTPVSDWVNGNASTGETTTSTPIDGKQTVYRVRAQP